MIRPSGATDARYKTARWQRLRERIIARDSAECQMCGCLTTSGRSGPSAAEVDHKVPHRGDDDLFWDATNLQCLCKRCHGSVKARQERGSRMQRSDGW
ncbi:HNH endonuclease [Falsirhodobacter halotolerans]|uniref:HNH endonuclease n=1 Tax=Falsirhodobacter halotolerans TaxID=1146892 RepID=UPI001FD4977B|nr:HNH endonuclease signature motif containing protein [Falsirhodobacter halotolerans]MCJ8138594.1 HNH endonuclease [Falsirhodobacter halotolerans]